MNISTRMSPLDRYKTDRIINFAIWTGSHTVKLYTNDLSSSSFTRRIFATILLFFHHIPQKIYEMIFSHLKNKQDNLNSE